MTADRYLEAALPLSPSRATSGYSIVPGRRYGFFTDGSLCIGCKACEVACKEWNRLPADTPSGRMELTATSYDNTGALSATTWRHVAFIEQPSAEPAVQGGGRVGRDGGEAGDRVGQDGGQAKSPTTSDVPDDGPAARWLMLSDVCKHCARAGCLEACPTGAIIRTEFDTVYVQQDVCNGCGYCVAACPFGVIEVDKEGDGKAHKCTLCYDRMKSDLEPACAQACPTDSIQFGPLDELRDRAHRRVEALRAQGTSGAQLYGADPDAEIGGLNAFFLLLDQPHVYGLPARPRLPSNNIAPATVPGALMGLALAVIAALALLIGRAERA